MGISGDIILFLVFPWAAGPSRAEPPAEEALPFADEPAVADRPHRPLVRPKTSHRRFPFRTADDKPRCVIPARPDGIPPMTTLADLGTPRDHAEEPALTSRNLKPSRLFPSRLFQE